MPRRHQCNRQRSRNSSQAPANKAWCAGSHQRTSLESIASVHPGLLGPCGRPSGSTTSGRPQGPVRICQRARRSARRTGRCTAGTYLVRTFLRAAQGRHTRPHRGGDYDARSPAAPDLRAPDARRRSQVRSSRRTAVLCAVRHSAYRHLGGPVLSKPGCRRQQTADPPSCCVAAPVQPG